jgi:hypothetical protein
LFLGIGREAAAGQLLAGQMITYAVAAGALPAAAGVRTSANIQILVFLTFHIRSPFMWRLLSLLNNTVAAYYTRRPDFPQLILANQVCGISEVGAAALGGIEL